MFGFFRNRSGMKQEELAQRLSMELGREFSPAMIGKYELGTSMFSAETLKALARILGVSSDELLGGSAPRVWWEYNPQIVESVTLERQDTGSYGPQRMHEHVAFLRDMLLAPMEEENREMRKVLANVKSRVLELGKELGSVEDRPTRIGPDSDEIGLRIRYYRKRAGLTTNELASVISKGMGKNYSANLIAKYEKGFVRVGANVTAFLTKVFGISSDELLGLVSAEVDISGLLDFTDIVPTDTGSIRDLDLGSCSYGELKEHLSELYDVGDALAQESLRLKNRSLRLDSLLEFLQRERTSSGDNG